MPTKKTAEDRRYTVNGKTLTWTTDPDDDDVTHEVSIPLRLKMRLLRTLGGDTDLTPETMFAMLEAIIPNQSDVLDDMDVNDFTRMFSAWQQEYQLLNGASLGEASSSPA